MRASHSVWGWIKTAPVVNLKSKFVGLAAVVHSEPNLAEQLRDLKQQKDIRKATHVITAWRIQGHNGTTKEGTPNHRIHQVAAKSVLTPGYDDDGEAPGGQRLLELMQVGISQYTR